jgi:hypothetical protein
VDGDLGKAHQGEAAVTLNYIDLTGSLGPAAATGSATFTASNWLVDSPDQELIPPEPVQISSLPAAGTFSTSLLATDNPAPLPAGWLWSANFQLSGIAANSFSFYLPAGPYAFTASHGTPAVFTSSAATFVNGTGVQLSGTLPGGFGSATTYYVVGSTSPTFSLAATSGGAALASTSTGSGSALTVSTDISSVAQYSAPPTVVTSLPVPSGVALAGDVPIATGSGQASVWGLPGLGSYILASAEGAADGVATLDSSTHVPGAQMRPFNARGQVQYSTTYNPWDVVVYYGEYILITAQVITGSGTDGLGQPFISAADYVKLTSQGWFWASDYGVSAGNADNWAALQGLLILVRSLSATGTGFKVVLPAGYIGISKTIILPTQTMLIGQGLYSTALRINAGANCDVVQPERYDSSAQAALLTQLQPSLTAGNLVNAFRWGIHDLTLHGNSTNQAPGSYYMGLNVQTNPLTSGAPSDPDFDPAGIVENVQFRACTGDGFCHNGRSALRLTNCIAWFNSGNGYSPSFDTQIDHCQAGFSGIAGFYLNHQADQGAGSKSYNNGQAAQWASGSNYTAGTRVMYNGTPYDAINALTGDTTPPSSDAANWAPVTATSPAAWGCGVYMDSNAGEITFNCDSQENSAWNWYFHDCTGTGIFASGVSNNPNFSQASSALNSANPGYYADVCIDGSDGVQVNLGCGSNSGHTPTQYRLRMVSSPARCDVTLTGDTNATFLTPDSVTLLGTGNSVSYNGASQTATFAGLNDVSLGIPTSGQVPTYNSATSQWNSETPPSGNYDGIFGDGSDGSATLDGTATVAWATKVGSLYTMSRDCWLTGLTIDSGVTLLPNGNRIFCQGTVTNAGSILCNGNPGSGSTAGPATGSGMVGGGVAGAAGQAGNGTGGSNGANATLGVGSSGAGGDGSAGTGGASASAGNSNPWMLRTPQILATGTLAGRFLGGGCGGGGGGGDEINKGGGGGSGGGVIGIAAWAVVNTGLISAAGGGGGTPPTGNCGGGAPGGGGLILLFTLTAWTNTGTTDVAAGTPGSGVGSGASGTTGTSGNVLNVVVQ